MSENTFGNYSIKAYHYILESILNNSMPIGSPISENEIAKELGLSRSPIREALKRLEAEGIVIHHLGRGTFVAPISVQDLEEIFELRILMELFAVETACRVARPDVINKIKRQFEALKPNSPSEEYHMANSNLHNTIMISSGNKRLQKFYSTLNTQITIVTRISARSSEHFTTSLQEHLSIIQAIQDCDVEKAKMHLRSHLERVRRDTIMVLLYEKGLV